MRILHNCENNTRLKIRFSGHVLKPGTPEESNTGTSRNTVRLVFIILDVPVFLVVVHIASVRS